MPLFIVLLNTSPLFGADKVSEVFTGKVVAVTDGDTIHVLLGEKNRTIRLNAVDAPEIGQPFSTQARHALGDKLMGKTVRVTITGHERGEHDLGDIHLEGQSVNEWLIREGWVWQFLKYSDSKRLAEIEKEARNAKKGLWADAHPEEPWVYRERMAAKRNAVRAAPLLSNRIAETVDNEKPTAQAPRSKIAPPPTKETTPETESVMVFVTKTGDKYHSAGCRHLKSKIPVSIEEAKARGLTACKVCGGVASDY